MNRESIIQYVKSPITLFALMVLVSEAILLAMAQDSDGWDRTIIIIGMVLVNPLVLFTILRTPSLVQSVDGSTDLSGCAYDVFISTPMAAWSEPEEYAKNREEILELREQIKQHCKYRNIFYAGVGIPSAEHFEPAGISVRDDFNAIKNSKMLILLYPEALATGALVEIGAALALGKQCVIFTSSRSTLPYILRYADGAFDNVTLHEYCDVKKIIVLLEQYGCALFSTKN